MWLNFTCTLPVQGLELLYGSALKESTRHRSNNKDPMILPLNQRDTKPGPVKTLRT